MTNKGSKFLQSELTQVKARARHISLALEEERERNGRLVEINKSMEADLLKVCNCNLWRGFWRLRALRIDLKKGTVKSQKK